MCPFSSDVLVIFLKITFFLVVSVFFNLLRIHTFIFYKFPSVFYSFGLLVSSFMSFSSLSIIELWSQGLVILWLSLILRLLFATLIQSTNSHYDIIKLLDGTSQPSYSLICTLSFFPLASATFLKLSLARS